MKRIVAIGIVLWYSSMILVAQTPFIYKGNKLHTEENRWLVDPTIEENQTNTFRSLKQALKKAEQYQQSKDIPDTLTLYIAPSVYWLDNPDTPEISRPLPNEGIPFGMKLRISNLKLRGISENPEDVIIACNRGQTQGADGNFTMLYIEGNNIEAENLTFGNYCNVDLTYPRNPALNRKKRADAIVQAQLIICKGDNYVARNCHFISRLNLCPFAGAKRILFDKCYFECTDDALCGTGIYHRCRFTLFSGKPFYNTQGTGAVFLNCDLHSLTNGRQYLTKVGSPVTMIDCRWTSQDPNLFIGWTQDPTDDLRCYQANLTLNGKPLTIQADKPWLTVDLSNKEALKAFRQLLPKSLFIPGGVGDTVVYNLTNLLGYETGQEIPYTCQNQKRMPVQLTLNQRKRVIETGRDTLHLIAKQVNCYDYPLFDKSDNNPIRWIISSKDTAYIKLLSHEDGEVRAIGQNKTEHAHTATLIAEDSISGLQAACVVRVLPSQLPPPAFIQKPTIRQDGAMLTVDYQLELEGREDHSLITWYRCTSSTDKEGTIVAVSRLNNPKKSYRLSAADKGYYIKATVAPKHLRSQAGNAVSAITSNSVKWRKEAYIQPAFETDFTDFPGYRQPTIRPGFWTVDCHKPLDTKEYEWELDTIRQPWVYGYGVDGAAQSQGLMQGVRGARIMYSPLKGEYNDMQVTLHVDPCKSTGQGFGSATGQYMDVFIKFAPQTLTGYALRIIRTPKNDKAVDFLLVSYQNGVVEAITNAVSSICYRKGCIINLKCTGDRLEAQVENANPLPPIHKEGLTERVYLHATITPNNYGGVGIQHTGSIGASATLLRYLKVTYADTHYNKQ